MWPPEPVLVYDRIALCEDSLCSAVANYLLFKAL